MNRIRSGRRPIRMHDNSMISLHGPAILGVSLLGPSSPIGGAAADQPHSSSRTRVQRDDLYLQVP
jgi:hypothetical protein